MGSTWDFTLNYAKMKKVHIKIGDIFSVKITENKKKYFQLIAFDIAQLNSDVIRAFEKTYPIDAKLDSMEIINDSVEFYAHCIIRLGVKIGLWEKAGFSADVGKLTHILFRGTSDYGIKKGEQPVKVSHNWYIWKLGDKNFTNVGRLQGECRKAEIGLVMNPYDIIDRIQTGNYKGSYPDFE